jgi:hypothetical protein
MDHGMSVGFRKLFNYISGKNSTGKKISLNIPDYVEQKEPYRTKAFVMPSKFSLKSLPKAQADSIAISEMPGGNLCHPVLQRLAQFGI